jgi:hypothetical protein
MAMTKYKPTERKDATRTLKSLNIVFNMLIERCGCRRYECDWLN